MNGWFITLIVLYAMKLGAHLHKHGQKPEENVKYNFWLALFNVVLYMGLIYMAIKTGF